MKLATLPNGTRDGRLAVVSSDLERYAPADEIAPNLQAALDDWSNASPRLREIYEDLEKGRGLSPFRQDEALAPLPRAFQWADGSAYVNHVELVRRARGAEMPNSFWTDPLMYQGGSDTFLAGRQSICLANQSWGIDMEGEIAVIVDDVPMGASAERAASSILLFMAVNDVSLRGLIPAELGKGFGFFQSKPPTAFSPVAATPDEFGDAWDGKRVHLPLCIDLNGEPFGRVRAGVDMTFGFPQLISHAAKTRPLAAGSIIGSGTVSNKLNGGPGKTISEGGVGYSCIAELRMVETIEAGSPKTPFLAFGDSVKIWMDGDDGKSIFGEIEQQVEEYRGCG